MLKKIILLFITALLLTNTIHAFDIEGTVYGFDGKPLIDAKLRLLSSQRREMDSTYTDGKGGYRIRNIPAGSYSMEISKPGMQKVTIEFGVGGSFYRSTVYHDFHLKDIARFESVHSSELKSLFLPEGETIPLGAFSSYRKGQKKSAIKKYNSALKHFQKAVKKHPGFSRCYSEIGDVYFQLQKYDEAEMSYQKAIKLNPYDPVPLAGYSRLLLYKNLYNDAVRYLSQAVDLDPGRAEYLYLLGEAQFKAGDSDAAEKTIMQGLMIQPRQAGSTRIILADIYYSRKQYHDSREMLSGYIRDNPFAEDREQIRKRLIELDRLIDTLEENQVE
ncbi:MAG: tetratricopeptide repeat protein [bacterium]